MSASCCTRIAGTFVVPLVALLLLIISFFAKIPGGIKWALIVFGVTVVQYALACLAGPRDPCAGRAARRSTR